MNLSEFTVGRFDALRVYFAGVQLQEFFKVVGEMSDYEWRELFEPKHRILAQIFWNTVLEPLQHLAAKQSNLQPATDEAARVRAAILALRPAVADNPAMPPGGA